MKAAKFNERDRKEVVFIVEKYFGIKLSTIRGKKFFQDQYGRPFWILGGSEDWHGIPSSMFSEKFAAQPKGYLIVAKKYQTKYEVYVGDLDIFLKNKDKLHNTINSYLHFNVVIKNDLLCVKEIEYFFLEKIDTKKTYVSDGNSSEKEKIIIRKANSRNIQNKKQKCFIF